MRHAEDEPIKQENTLTSESRDDRGRKATACQTARSSRPQIERRKSLRGRCSVGSVANLNRHTPARIFEALDVCTRSAGIPALQTQSDTETDTATIWEPETDTKTDTPANLGFRIAWEILHAVLQVCNFAPRRRSRMLFCRCEMYGGRGRDRTGGLIVANDALSQLSYTPTAVLV